MQKSKLTKLLCLVLSLLMILGAAPLTAFADDSDFEIMHDSTVCGYHGAGGDVVIPDRIRDIEMDAFAGNTTITSVSMQGVEFIMPFAFRGCTGLVSATMPNVRYIEDGVFADCTNLTSITVSDNLMSASRAFTNCTKLTTVYCTCTSNVDNVKNAINNDAYTYVKLNHTYVDGKCTACGQLCTHAFVENVCSVCGYVCNHAISVYTDNGDGTHFASCLCGRITEEKIAHCFNDYINDNNANCTEDGTKTAKCDYCDALDVITLTGTAKGHNFTGVYKNNGDGTHSIKCANCDTYSDAESDEYTYTYVNNGDGTHSGKCICGEVSTEKVAHNFVNGFCSFCGSKCEHNVVDGMCTICNCNSEMMLKILGTKIEFGKLNGNPAEWIVTGFGANGLPAPDGCISLGTAQCVKADVPFSNDNSNIYATSNLRTAIENSVTFTATESDYIKERKLDTVSGFYYYLDGVAGPSVEAKLWAPTANDARGLAKAGLSYMGTEYWMCSPGNAGNKVGYFWMGGDDFTPGQTVEKSFDARAFCYLDFSKVCKLKPVEGKENTFSLEPHDFVNGVCTRCGLCLHINGFTASYVNNGDGTHSGKCSCGEVSTEKDVHTFVNGVCSLCGAAYEYTAENNVLTATANDAARTAYTLTLTENGTISAEEVSAWNGAYLTLPNIVFDVAANTASITVGDATATVTLAEGTLKAHSVKVICGADANGNNIITDVMPGTAVTVTAGTYEGKLFEKWNAGLSVNGSTDETVTFNMPNEDITLEAEFVDCYALSVFDGTTLTSEPQKVGASEAVTAAAAPEGKVFKNWTAEGLTLPDATASSLEFTMPANAVMLTSNYGVLYSVTVSDGTVTNGDTSVTAFAGDTVSVTADADTDDSRFTQWSSEADITFADKTAKTTTFTMPDADVSVTAEREQSYTVTVTDGTVVSGLNGANKAFFGQTIKVKADSLACHRFIGWTGDGVTFANAANASTTFTMPEGNVTVKANHEAIKVTAPTAGTKTYTYSGDYQSYEFANEGDKSYYTLSGNVQKNAGTYTVKAHLTVDGTVWADGTTADKEFTFVINRQPVDKPIAYNTQYYYTGAEQSFILCRQIGSSYYYYETTIPSGSVYIRGNTRTDAGSQAVTVTPADNYCWQDGTTGTLYFSFTINRYPIPTLFDDSRSFTYNGNAQTYTPFVMRNGSLYDFDGLYYKLSNRTQTAAGSYTVTATLDNNFCWYDGSTAARNFSFNIRMKELDSFIYYVNDLKTGENEVCVDMTYTSYDNTNTLKGFERRPGFKPEMLKDRYQPCLMNVPAGADVMFYLKETPGTPKNISEVSKCKRWNDVKMSDLQPNTIYYMFAVVTHPDYPGFQITEVNNMSRFITSVPQFTLINCKHVKETEVNQHYKFECAMAMVTGNVNAMLGAFGNKSTSKYVNVTTKVANYTNIEDALAQAIKDIEGGLDGALIGWYDEHGVMQSFSIFPSNLAQARTVLANLTKKSVVRSAPRKMLAAPAGDPVPVEITGVTGEVPELTDELLNSMFTPEELALLPLDNAEFKVEKELETGAEQIEAEKEALLAKLAALDITPEEEAEGFSYTATVGNILYDPATGLVDGESNDYELAAGEKLPAEAVKEIEGYTFIGLYYKEIMGFEKDVKPEEATGDHGMILTQGLVKWDPETDFVTRDLDLMALYVKDGAEEPVGYKADGTTFLDAGSEVTVTLPALLDGMTYGDVLNEDEDITVNAVSEGKVTVTLTNDVTGDEPFTFKVFVNANAEDIEDPFYYILVTVNAVDETAIKEEAAETIEALADDTASDAVKAIISEAVASLEDANSIEAVNKIVADTAAAVALQEAKEAAIAAIDAAVAEAANSELEGAAESAAASAEEAKAAINAATTIEEVNEAEKAGTSAIVAASVCEHCGTKHQNIIFKIICKLIQLIHAMLDIFKTIGF